MKNYIMIFLTTFLVGCAMNSSPKTKVEYGEWQTDRFRVWAIVVPEGLPSAPPQAVLNTFKGGKLVEVIVPEGSYKEGEEVTLTYRLVTKTICTDENCRFEESYEVK
jgi:hypothetical protein